MKTYARAYRFSLILPVLLLSSCTSSEKKEALRFCKLLTSQASELDRLNSQEAATMQSMQAWSGQEAFMGGGSATLFGGGNISPQQTQAATNARNARVQLLALGTNLKSTIQELKDLELVNPYDQTMRNGIVQTLEPRIRLFEELDPLLLDYERNIVNPNLQFGMRPASIDTISARSRGYQAPSNNIAQAVQEIRIKYSISDTEIQKSSYPKPGTLTLLSAVKANKAARVQELLDRGASVDGMAPNGMTPLTLACGDGEVDIVKLLLEKGANPNLATGGPPGQFDAGLTPLLAAMTGGKIEIIQMLLDKHADPNTKLPNGKTVLQLVSECGPARCGDILELLKKAGAR